MPTPLPPTAILRKIAADAVEDIFEELPPDERKMAPLHFSTGINGVSS